MPIKNLKNHIHPKATTFNKWVKTQQGNFAEVVNSNDKKIIHIDLSVSSWVLGNNSNFEDIQKFERRIDRFLEDEDAQIAWGGYGEVRPFYTTDAYQTEGKNGAQWRTVHLGMDFWSKAETPVFAPLKGTVHSFADNKGDCNYGPTIILQHEVSPKLTFYTLYGHLTRDSLDGLKEGMKIEKGQQIAKIGSSLVNGKWPSHLHFQIVLDMQGEKGDFAGVAYPHEKEAWLSLCPNPNLLFPKLQTPISSKKDASEILEMRHQYLGKSLSISYQKPLHFVRGYKQYLYDTTARRYLDTVNNVAHVGHQHPRIVQVAQRQMGLLNTNTRYLHENIVLFAEELLATLPSELSVVYFVNSGSEANELALRMVKACTGQKNMMAIETGYHGNTGGCIDISSYKFDGKGGNGKPPHTHLLPIPDTFRGLYRNPKTASKQYAEHASQIIEGLQKEGKKLGGFIAESILSCGGQIVLPDGYLKAVYQVVRAQGGLCIADEVQVGFGRVGERFWGFELQDVVPDIVTMGKPIGNGHPLAAVVTTQEVAEKFANGMEYFNTFGGNPVSCAIGREVLKVVQEEKLQQNALEIGAYLIKELKKLQSRFSIIGDVRGKGLFLGIELVKNLDTLEPAAKETAYIANQMRERGILMSIDGPYHNVLKIKPPMCFTKANVDFLAENLEVVMGSLETHS
ncbi:MAG: aminotransferase class III-fold pyridoxal phosphate-dependent enzyme [Chitinophagales bacterium]